MMWELNEMLKIFKEELLAKERCSFYGGGGGGVSAPKSFTVPLICINNKYLQSGRMLPFCN